MRRTPSTLTRAPRACIPLAGLVFNKKGDMPMSDDYTATRERYVALCIKKTPENQRGERAQAAAHEFDAFCGHPQIIRVTVADPVFAFVTTPLIMDGPDGPRMAGAYAVRIDAQTTNILCRALDREGTKNQHPHVFTNFIPCLGIANQLRITKMFGDGKMVALGLFMIGFLEQYGEDDRYEDPKKWDPATEEEIARWKNVR